MDTAFSVLLLRARRARRRRRLVAFAVFAAGVILLSVLAAPVRADGLGDLNIAHQSMGAVATASGSANGRAPGDANDGDPNTYWQCNKMNNCWLRITFPSFKDFDEVDLHMPTSAIAASVDLYADLNGDGNYGAGEVIHQMTGNAAPDVVIPLPFTNAKGVQVKFLSMTQGSGNPAMKEIEVYLRDADQDGLFNGFEMQKRYVQDAKLPDVPRAVADGGSATFGEVRVIPWDGILVSATGNFTIEHADPNEVTVQIGYYNATAARWVDRFVWNPGGLAPLPQFRVEPAGAACCVAKVQAVMTNKVVAAEARFYVDGVLRHTLGDWDTSGQLTIMFPRWEWSWDTYAEAETEHSVEIVLLDRNGNAVWNSSTVRVDNTAPASSVVSPANGQTVSGTVLVNASATDDYQMGKVQFLVDGIVRGTATTPVYDSYYNWDWDTRPYVDGPHTLEARAWDAAGNSADGTISVTVENPPDVAIRAPAASAEVRGTVTVAAHADDPSGIQKVDFYVDEVLRFTDTLPDGNFYNWSWDTTLDWEGARAVKAVATDNYGLTNDHEIQVTVDNTAPEVSILEPAPGALLEGENEAEGTVVVRVDVTEQNTVDVVQLFADGNLRVEETVPVTGNEYRLKWDTYEDEPDGPHTLTVKAYDAAGNLGTAEVAVTVDNHYPPSVQITSPLPDEIVYCDRGWQGDCRATVSVSASDDEGLDYVEVTLPPGYRSRKSAPPFDFDWQPSKVPDGRHTIVAKAVDLRGLWTRTQVSVCINSCMPGGPGMPEFGMGGEGGPTNSLVGFDPLTGESEAPVDAKGVTGTADLQDMGNYTWTIRDVDVTDDAPWTGWATSGDDHTVAVDLAKYVRDLTAEEKAAGLLAPNFTAQDISSFGKWRIVVRDWIAGNAGNLTSFTFSIAERTDPLDPDTDGDGVSDGQEIIVQDLDGDGWKELHEITQVRSIPVAVDTDADGLTDDRELDAYLTDPFEPDTDEDGLSDFDEVEQYYFMEAIPLDETIENVGIVNVTYVLPETDHYLYKFLMNVTVERYEAGWGGELTAYAWFGRQNDAMIEGRLRFLKDSQVAPSGSRGEVVAVNNTPPSFLMEERRFLVSLTSDTMDAAGMHTATLDLMIGQVNEDVTVRVTSFEIHRRSTLPTDPDTDGDGLKDGDEADWGARPWEPDTDLDGLWDGWQDMNGDGEWQPGEPMGEVGNATGVGGWGTDPTRTDTDGDGLWDGYDLPFPWRAGELSLGTRSTSNDTDGDGLLDGWDDADGDGTWDPGEGYGENGDYNRMGSYLTNPLLRDSDGDTVHDGWELANGFNPTYGGDAFQDGDFDGWDARFEFLLDTDPADPDSDDDNLLDPLEVQDVLIRTSVEEGALRTEHYGVPGDWIAYTGFRYAYDGSVTDDTSDSPANSNATETELVVILDDGGRLYHNVTLDTLYLWLPGADHDDTDFNGTGDGYLNGTYHRFARTPTPELLSDPLPGYWHREVYRGSSPRDNDTDEDGILDGDEVDWALDADGDGWRNNADPDADDDGIWDGDEIDWAVDSDGDGKANMVDPDSDHPSDGGTPDGLEPLWNDDLDGDGLANMVDPDNDGDNLPDEFEDEDHDGLLGAGESDLNLFDTDGDGLWDGWRERNGQSGFQDWDEVGEDVDADGVVDLLETDPAKADTDGDGLSDAVERRLGEFWREAEDHPGSGGQVAPDANAVGEQSVYAPNPSAGDIVYDDVKPLSGREARYRLLLRARQFDENAIGTMLVKRLDSGTEYVAVAVNTTFYAWYSLPVLEADLAGSVTLSVREGGSASTFYLDRIALVRVDYYHQGRTCGPAATVAFTFTDGAGGNGTFCYEVPASAYPRSLVMAVKGIALPRADTTVSPMQVARMWHASAAANGIVYVFGGKDAGGSPTNSFERYDPSKGTWQSPVTDGCSPSARYGASMATPHGELVVTGGVPTLQEVLRYSPGTNSWACLGNVLSVGQGRESHASVVANGRVYLLGGYDGGYLSTVVSLDLRRTPPAITMTPQFQTARSAHAAVFLDGYIYVVGGEGAGGYLSSVERWNPSQPGAMWTSVNPLDTPRKGAGAAVIDGKIWVFGGYNGGYLSSVEVFDPATGQWSYASVPLPQARVWMGSAEVNGTAFLTGGNLGSGAVSSVLAYNVSYPSGVSLDFGADRATEWSRRGILRGEVEASHLASGLAGQARRNAPAGSGKALLVGGLEESSPVAAADAVFLTLFHWESLPPLPEALSRAAAAVSDGVLYVAGGQTSGGGASGTVWALDLASYAWTTVAPLTPARHSLTLTALDGKLYAIGGESGAQVVRWTQVYDPQSDSWSPLRDMLYATGDHASVPLDGRIYVIGGHDGAAYRGAVQVYDPATDTWSEGPSLWEARAGLRAATYGGAIYAIGGRRADAGPPEQAYSAKVEVLFPGADTWLNASAMPAPAGYFAVASVGGRIYVMGGTDEVAGQGAIMDSVLAYDVSTDSWTAVGAMAGPRAYAAGAFAEDLVPVLVRVDSTAPGTVQVTPGSPLVWPVLSDPSQPDSDGDALTDADELEYATHSLLVDSDLDRLNDGAEREWGLRPDLHDTDGDGLWDGYFDADWDGVFDAPLEVGEDVNLDGVRDPDETDPVVADFDGDGLPDGEELRPGFQWFEAEFHAVEGATLFDEDGDGTNDTANAMEVTAVAPETGTYRFFVLAKGNGSAAQSLTFSYRVDGEPPQSKTVPLYYETHAGSKEWSFRWSSTEYFTLQGGASVTFSAPDAGLPEWLRVDRVLFVRADEVTVSSVTPDPLYFQGDVGTSLTKSVVVTIPATPDGVPRYVVKAFFDISVSYWIYEEPPERVFIEDPLVAVVAGRALCFQPDWEHEAGGYTEALEWIDYSGEFNRFLALAGWDGSASIDVVLTFAAFTDCAGGELVEIVDFESVTVILEPVGSSPLARDTDGDGLDDRDERRNGTSPLRANSDGDQIRTVVGPGVEFWDCTDLRETTPGDTTCEPTPDATRGTNPVSMDTDGDGGPPGDGGPDGPDLNPWTNDIDGDGVIDAAERKLGTNPLDPDTDRDLLLDGGNVTMASTDPRVAPWTARGIKFDSWVEGPTTYYRFWGERGWGTLPTDADTDDDWLKDGDEAEDGLNPLRWDMDGDGFPDGWEVKFDDWNGNGLRFDPKVSEPAGLDSDGDGLTNLDEYVLGTQWCLERRIPTEDCTYDVVDDGEVDFVLLLANDDKDAVPGVHDGIPTADELFYGSDPYVNDLATDLDGDGLTNEEEYYATPQLDYGEPDTDGDGWGDDTERRYWSSPQTPCPLGGWAVCTTTYDVDGDGIADGDEVDGWYVWTLIDPEAGEWLEFHVASDPNDTDTDDDGVPDGTEYLRSDPTTGDTDGDGLTDWFPADPIADAPPPGKDDNVVEPEKIPPTMSDIVQNARLEWCGIFVCHTWLDLKVTATDNSGVAAVTFTLKDTGATREGLPRAGNWYGTTFEIDFWSDYMWGYEVEARAYDLAGNVMAKTAGGGLTYLIGKLVAGFLSFLLGPAIGGAVFGFFLGMLAGLFEDLSIFLQIGEIAKAITQLPKLIGDLAGNPSMLMAMFVDMINAHMTRCMLVNPYGTPPGTTEQWQDWVAKRFFGEEPGGTSVVIFGVACTVGSIVGYLVQQFLIGTGIAKVLGKLKDAGKFATLGKKLSDGAKAVKETIGAGAKAAKSVAKGAVSGLARKAAQIMEILPFKWADDAASGMYRVAGKWGSGLTRDMLRQVPDANDLLVLMGRMGGKNADEIELLVRKSLDTNQNWAKGARFHLDRIKHYGDDIDGIEVPVGGKRVDLRLKDGTIVEVKDVSAATFGSGRAKYARQIQNYHDLTGADVILELKQWVDPQDVQWMLNGRPWLTIIPGVG